MSTRIAEAQQLSDELDKTSLADQNEALSVTSLETIAENELAAEKAGLEKIGTDGGTLNEDQTKRLSELNAAAEARKLEAEKNLSPEEKSRRDAENTKKADEEKKKTDEAAKLSDDEKKKAVEKKIAEEAAATNVIPKELAVLFPEAKELGHVAEAVKLLNEEIATERAANKVVSDILDANVIFTDVLVGLKNGENVFDLIRTALSLEKDQAIPDPQKNPAEYETFVAKKIEKENAIRARIAQEKKDKEKDEAEKKINIAAGLQADADLAVFAAKHGMNNDEAKKFVREINFFINGDPETRILPSDFFERMYAVLRSPDELKRIEAETKKREEAALLDGKNKGIEAARTAARSGGDGLPGGSGKTSLPALNDGLDTLRQVVTKTRRIGDPVAY